VKQFSMPSGVELVTLDKVTNLLADSTCPQDYTAAFLEGTAPTESCEHAALDTEGMTQRVMTMGAGQPPPPIQEKSSASVTVKVPVLRMSAPDATPAPAPEKKKGFFGKLFGKKGTTPPDPTPAPPQ
jgi:penicillin-binding protein 1B